MSLILEQLKFKTEPDATGLGRVTFEGRHYDLPMAVVLDLKAMIPGWTFEDLPLPEDGDIAAAHPLHTGGFKRYETAMRLVGAKRSKGALVELVNWLLYEIEQRGERIACYSV